MHLINFDPASFLRDYWQKKPLLIRDAWSGWRNPLTPDELAGLACEEGVESRLITRQKDRLAAEDGPLPETRFSALGGLPWTLLVQAADHHIPAVAELIEPFRFIPNWRIDDIMVSYASDGGGVGAHFDQYDVFLIQGLGRRRWQIGGHCDENSALLPHDSLRLLADFQPVEEWVLEPGDMLYVPPGFAHNGVAVGDDCMTYSVGFRAPSRSELIGDFADHLIENMLGDPRYGDPDLSMQDNPGEITPAAIRQLHRLITDALLDKNAFAHWFGQYNSRSKNPDMDWSPDEMADAEYVENMLRCAAPLKRNPACRFSFIRRNSGELSLFVDGGYFDLSGETARFAETLCAHPAHVPKIDSNEQQRAIELIIQLLNRGCVIFLPL